MSLSLPYEWGLAGRAGKAKENSAPHRNADEPTDRLRRKSIRRDVFAFLK